MVGIANETKLQGVKSNF